MRPTFALTAALSALAMSAAPTFASNLVVPIDHSVRLNLAGNAASVVIGNPKVADVTVVDSHTVFISGRGYGGTDIEILDQAGRSIYSGDVVVANADDGLVSIYRGASRTDLACAPGCSVSIRSPGDSAGGGGGGGTTVDSTSETHYTSTSTISISKPDGK